MLWLWSRRCVRFFCQVILRSRNRQQRNRTLPPEFYKFPF